jgi:hypothetical protein
VGPYLAMYGYGALTALTRVELVISKRHEPVPWRWLWFALALLGPVIGAIQWSACGWFYALRVRWSGATNVDKYQARMVYAYSSLIYTLPGLAVL